MARPRIAFAAALALALAFVVLGAVPASGHGESAAPTLRPDVVAAWHDPPLVEPHTQWHGYLRLAAGSNVTAASYQICRVGLACFAPPTPARDLGNGTWGFDTADYTVNGRAVDYEPGWRLGVKWWLNESSMRTVQFPEGPDTTSPACADDAALSCAEAHYLAFDVEHAAKGTPVGLWPAVAAVALATALSLVRRGRAPGRGGQ